MNDSQIIETHNIIVILHIIYDKVLTISHYIIKNKMYFTKQNLDTVLNELYNPHAIIN